jgi:hypothetical protein
MATITRCDSCNKKQSSREEYDWVSVNIYCSNPEVVDLGSGPLKFVFCPACGKIVAKKVVVIASNKKKPRKRK